MSALHTPPNPLLRAVELQNLGRFDESAGLFREVLAEQPHDAVALYSLSGLLMRQPAPPHDEVLGLTERGVSTSPGFAPLWFARAMALQAVGRRDEALAAYDRALVLQPAYKEALLNSGAMLREMHRHVDALERFNRLLEIDPNHASALGNLGILLTEFKRSDQAMAMFERLLAIDPDYPYAPGLLAYERLHACDWRDVEPLTEQIVQGLHSGKKVCKTLGLMAMNDSAADHLKAARIFNTHWFPKPPAALWNGERYTHRRLRIAYVSPDLREHPVGHLLAGVIEQHDKRRFETIAISLGVDDSSRLRARMQAAFDRFIDARGMTALQIARLMREMEVDVAIDLAGYTSDSRTEVFAHRPAPLQVGWLGYPGTMGADYFDYILADRHTIPPEHEVHYTEKVARLPDTYLPTDGSIQIAERTPTRAECGLPETGAVFCAFSHDYKVHPRLFEVWMNILRRTPGSVLWLVSRNAFSQQNLRREAAARGIDPARLIFATRVKHVEDHLARYRLADVFLDTTPYNAHTTAADALMAGLPVLTCMGDAFPARVAGSLLHAVGLPEMVTHSLADYEALAVALIEDPQRLVSLKAKLLANRSTHALFDTPRFCRNLEDVLMNMVQEIGATVLDTAPPPRRLHIGGKLRAEGWELMNALPAECVDHLGNANDLSRFADATFDTLYASHVVEHFDYQGELGTTLREWCRVLKPGGELLISVPDLEVLAGLILDKGLAPQERFMAMRMIFGGHVDAYDYHGVGLTAEFLQAFLGDAGFASMQRVEGFGLFPDTSDYQFAGRRISLNVRAVKAAATGR
jgi:predicted O-linked N-acetylglucosamine transferase (SPINDLY family)/predicted SAM-dependent methyltransferase